MNPETNLISCQGLERRLQSGDREITVLQGIDIEVQEGEFLAVLGPSGSGKSTLLALLAGIDRPSGGEIYFRGQQVDGLSENDWAKLRRREIGFVFQNFQLIENLTAMENVSLPLELNANAKAQERTKSLLNQVGLRDRGHHYPSQLSGGEQQRVALARAFAVEPALLLADEPTGNLDRETGAKIVEMMLDMRAEHKTTLVLVTHDPHLAREADRQLVIDSGRLRTNEEVNL